MKDHEGCKRGFYWQNKAWYHRPQDKDGIMFGLYHNEGGTTGEMSVTWEPIGGKMVPKLGVFDDAWSALSLFGDLMQRLAKVDDENITEEVFVTILEACGFQDMTSYESPYPKDETILRNELAGIEDRAKEIRGLLKIPRCESRKRS